MKDAHPFIAFSYFVAVIALTMCASHPLLAALSLAVGLLYLLMLKGPQAALRLLGLAVFVILVVVAFQLLFTHQGFTVIFWLLGNPVTLESIIYGLSLGCMLAAVLIWFSCFQEVVGTDRLMALFSRSIPTTAMMISMIFNFIPQILQRGQQINDAYQALAYVDGSPAILAADAPAAATADLKADAPAASGWVADAALERADQSAPGRSKSRRQRVSWLARLRWPVRLSSILMGWSMESGLATTASMRARAYGVARRTSYLPLIWTRRDTVLSTILVALLVLAIIAEILLLSGFLFYPTVTALGAPGTYLLVAAFLGFPLIYEGGVRLKWRLSSF